MQNIAKQTTLATQIIAITVAMKEARHWQKCCDCQAHANSAYLLVYLTKRSSFKEGCLFKVTRIPDRLFYDQASEYERPATKYIITLFSTHNAERILNQF